MKLILERWNRFLKEDTGKCFPGERTLYHGTLIDNLESIKKFGLDAEIADEEGLTDFVDSFYDEPDDDHYYDPFGSKPQRVVFLSDKHELDKTVTSMRFHISKKLDKDFHDVTVQDIRIHGLLVIAKCVDAERNHASDSNPDYEYSSVHGVEPGDYYFESIRGDIYLSGKKLVRFLRGKGLIPWASPFGSKTK